MGIFDDIRLKWDGAEYVIPHNRVLRALAAVEEVATFEELSGFAARRTAPLAKIAMAYGVLLRFAGANVTDEDVYQGMFANGGATMAQTVSAVLAMMIPSERILSGGGSVEGNAPSEAVARASTKKRTKRLSGVK
jgi:hypothetical protein